MFSTESFRPTWAEIDLSLFFHNYRMIAQKTQKPLIAVVKADAYGHGALRLASFLEQKGVEWFAVATIDEAIELREGGIKGNILILGPVESSFLTLLFSYDLTPTIVSLVFARDLNRVALSISKKIAVHVKVDTGMGRLGILSEEVLKVIEEMKYLPGIELQGVYSHFPAAGQDKKFSQKQIMELLSIREESAKKGVSFLFCHIANSEAIWNLPESYGEGFTHIRCGLSLYGGLVTKNKELLPVMSLKTRIVQIKRLSRGKTVSYLRQYVVKKPWESIAVLPLGYADGVPTIGSGRYEVIIKGKRYPQVGRVCMDYMMVSLGKNSDGVTEKDDVVVFGEGISLFEFGERCGRIPYEVMCGISKRVPRVYKGEENDN